MMCTAHARLKLTVLAETANDFPSLDDRHLLPILFFCCGLLLPLSFRCFWGFWGSLMLLPYRWEGLMVRPRHLLRDIRQENRSLAQEMQHCAWVT